MESRTLNDGTTIPALGFGTYPLTGGKGQAVLLRAIDAGYRLLDSAVNYGNEVDVGDAIRRSRVPRAEFVIQSKIPGRHHAYEKALASVRTTLQRMGIEQLDVGLIHWPNPSVGLYGQAWRALVDAQRDGLVRTIGVSNFHPHHLARIIDVTGVVPAINQVEMHPYFPQVELRAEHERLGIVTEAWSPLAKGMNPFAEPAIADTAATYGVSPAQVILKWHLQLGSVPLPKSEDAARQRANLELAGFELTAAELAAITALGRTDGRRFGGDPDRHEES
ncbi:MAG: aldo/keto reductase [Nostocoides sp.]|jgi:2,5-diketo-D-gluconate reductase A|uniref:aldo/keto reductase n=1 Tax=Nostocoides sp. TaxID=1917966 RepID=UPI003BD34DFF